MDRYCQELLDCKLLKWKLSALLRIYLPKELAPQWVPVPHEGDNRSLASNRGSLKARN